MVPDNKNNRVIFLFGPTAVGKTAVLRDLFSHGFEVVNADSIQVYRGLDIGSAKADAETLAAVPHHLIDIRDPWESWNVADFISLADKACGDIRKRGAVPVISGGTAYYFRHFLYGLSEAPAADVAVRERVAAYIASEGLDAAYKRLCAADPVSGARINPNDGYRISRALEVYESSGKPLSAFKVPSAPRNGMEVLALGLCRDRTELASRIRERVELMFTQGLVDEVKNLVYAGACARWQSMRGIGYREFFEAAAESCTQSRGAPACSGTSPEQNCTEPCAYACFEDPEAVKERIIMDSIHYAKRQMTFFRSFSNVRWVSPDRPDEISVMVSDFLKGD